LLIICILTKTINLYPSLSFTGDLKTQATFRTGIRVELLSTLWTILYIHLQLLRTGTDVKNVLIFNTFKTGLISRYGMTRNELRTCFLRMNEHLPSLSSLLVFFLPKGFHSLTELTFKKCVNVNAFICLNMLDVHIKLYICFHSVLESDMYVYGHIVCV